ncbi:hypothetical protein N7471_004824 [Penicillium samsonianum]|uniref:uncharacterized protein n=1 Tax=Penicillium samsonianum TaxID=1882272 RepID=UPI002546A872|nr:uncharacterized protein N7471_004824 [Penicillium samsonianum]KAJ6138338.1 hypothetical protein N7471_004824 [Penicillium samsonianum]
MRPSEVVIDAIKPVAQYVKVIARVIKGNLKRILALIRLYGLSGMLVAFCGSSNVWQVEAKVIGELDDDQAIEFRKSVQDECSMIAVAAALVAQIAITSLSLSDLSKTHWVARGLFALSLISSLSAVTCAATQHIVMTPLLSGDQIRAWIRGGNVTTYLDPVTLFCALFESMMPGVRAVRAPIIWAFWVSRIKVFQPCRPQDDDVLTKLDHRNTEVFDYSLMRLCFTPGVIPVITMSAPIILLAISILSVVIAFGIYFGFTWTKNLDSDAGLHDSRNVFILYIVGLGLCTLVYLGSQLIQNESLGDEYQTVGKYSRQYMENHPERDWRRPEPVIVPAAPPV